MPTEILDLIPLWLFFFLSVMLSLLCVEAGFQLSSHHHLKASPASEASFSSMANSALGLLAFMLAFTFGVSAARYDERRLLVLDDANAIQVVYLRCDLIPEPMKTRAQNILRQYVQVRLKGGQDYHNFPHAVAEAEELQRQLWSQATAVGLSNGHDEMSSLFVQSVNDLIDVHGKRLMARMQGRIPETVWVALFAIAAVSMAGVGYQCGFGEKRSILGSVVLAFTFSTVLLLIADLDRPWEGFLRVNQTSMIELGQKISPPLSGGLKK